jgi:hypothetical protein
MLIEPNQPNHWCGEPWRVINKENTRVEAEEPRHRCGESRGHISGKLEIERYVRTSQLYRKKDIRLQVLYKNCANRADSAEGLCLIPHAIMIQKKDDARNQS